MPEKLKIYEKKCPICGKIIASLVESQMEYNFKIHYNACKRKNGNEEEI